MTMEYQNSQNSVWIAIQEALLESGFMIANGRILDKEKGTTKQLLYVNAVRKDLILQKDANLLMYYQNAKTRLGEQPEQLNLI